MHVVIILSEASPNTSLSWLLWITLGFFFLMVVVGWLASRKNTTRAQPDRKTKPSNHSTDDLKIIEGIGPKVAKILNQAGYVSFTDLASSKPAEVDKVLDIAGLQMMDSAGWIQQAKLAAKGEMEKLAKLQKELKGGRKIK